MSTIDNGRLLRVDLNELGSQAAESAFYAHRKIQEYYRGIRAAVFMDKDETMQDPDAALPSDSRLPDTLKIAQKQAIASGIDSNSSPHDLIELGTKIGMHGLHIAERGAVICGFPDGLEIHLTQSGEWLSRQLLMHFAQVIREDPKLGNDTFIAVGDPWTLIHNNAQFPGAQSKLVMLNGGRHASLGVVTGLLDHNGNIVRKTDESRAFFEEVATLFKTTRAQFIETHSFPDPAGMLDDFSKSYEVINIVSAAASKRIAIQYMAEVLGIPVFHMGDNKQDDMRGIPGVTTMAVGNGSLKYEPGVIAAKSPMATGVIELYEENIFPRFQ